MTDTWTLNEGKELSSGRTPHSDTLPAFVAIAVLGESDGGDEVGRVAPGATVS